MIAQLSTVFCPSVKYLSFFCEAFSWTILDSTSFPLFHSGQVFHQLVCPLTVVLPQIFFSLTTLSSQKVFFCLFLLGSFRFKSFLSQFSTIVITLPKKDSLQQCQNYRTISLISHPSKVMLKILLKRLKPQTVWSCCWRPYWTDWSHKRCDLVAEDQTEQIETTNGVIFYVLVIFLLFYFLLRKHFASHLMLFLLV